MIVALLAACGNGGASPSASTESSTAASASSAPSASSAAAGCSPESLETKSPDTFTVGTDNPAFPPYFAEPEGDESVTEPWEFGDPTNGRGFESAVAYALAEQLGFSQEQVTWIPVPFNNSFAPGEKDFDVYLAQVSYTDERTQGADLSEGYFFGNQALVARAGSDLAGATTIAEVAEARLGAAGNTTSLAYIQERIQPTEEPRVYEDNTGALAALNADQVDGILVDVPTAFFIVNVEMDDGVVVGQLPSDPQEQEHFSMVLELDSPLTDCVDEALLTMGENGELDSLAAEWLSDFLDAPQITE
ncbi:MAG: amino acid ABC transporter substrate-binding protein [Chloroflexi bacterium]|nr:amino acid ABC transporter substrate-binding protein [Chloroflexota bacterium]